MTYLKQDPIEIRLSEIPEQGRHFTYTDQHRAMRAVLKDVVNKNPFKIQIFICPSGNLFEVTGLVETGLDLQCYRCAVDFTHSVREKIHELLVIEGERPRSSQSARVNYCSELNSKAPSVTSLTNEVFNLGDFFHEIIVLAEPIQPKAKKDCGDDCKNLKEAYLKGWLNRPGQNLPLKEISYRPFQVLKDFKLNN